ncbi:MAG: CxxxxCH/CxxCH domain-containing protein, partial [Deltaproteobacteria bacterium]|nr:CxxxxCH/CxxCH domain-containing protein [Deltaproteobacteria bacterium]
MVVVLALALFLAIPSLLMAAGPGVHFFDCKNCHLAGLTIQEIGGQNVCLSCHETTQPDVTLSDNPPPGLDGHTDSRFSFGDASNLYGNNPYNSAELSHNWAAPTDNLAAAGATPPNMTNYKFFYSRYGTSHGKVTCTRCHNPHGELATNPSLLIMQNDAVTPMEPDTMCKACHTSFAAQGPGNKGFLSHPIGVNYSSVASGNPDYNAVPNNGTAGDLTLLPDGTISCTTCHGVHATDSDANTADGFTSGELGMGDGLMLKHTGPMGEDVATGDSICKACHTHSGHSMGTANGDLGCMVCHGGHEYDATAPNYYMLKKQVTLPYVPKLAGPGTVTLDYTVDPDTISHYNNGALCLDCHDLPGTHNAADPCADCHAHGGAGNSFGAGCGSCHGYAPFLNEPGDLGNGGYAKSTANPTNDYSTSGVFKDESATPHQTHSNNSGNYTFGCDNCHGTLAGNLQDTTNHDAGSFQQVLDASIGALPALTTANGTLTSIYDESGSGSCSAVYCHSNGRVQGRPESAALTTATATPWASGLNTITTCDECHDVRVGGTKSHSPAHDAHLNQGFACGICHTDTSADGTTLVAAAIGGEHVNGVVDGVFSGVANTGGIGVYDDTQGTCAVYCHTNGAGATVTTPDWDDAQSGQCGDCHGGPLGTESSPGVPSEISSGSHTVHLNAGLNCDSCHPAGANTGTHAGHIDGDGPSNYDVVVDCNTCHGATATVTTGPDREPIWGNSSSVDCTT